MKKKTIVVDSDGLIGLFDEQDAHFTTAHRVVLHAKQNDIILIYPASTLVETVTTFQRKLQKPELAAKVIGLIAKKELTIEPIDGEILHLAAQLFKPTGSKQNTLFDAIVAAVAQKYDADGIFSFDVWYRSVGLKLASDISHLL